MERGFSKFGAGCLLVQAVLRPLNPDYFMGSCTGMYEACIEVGDYRARWSWY